MRGHRQAGHKLLLLNPVLSRKTLLENARGETCSFHYLCVSHLIFHKKKGFSVGGLFLSAFLDMVHQYKVFMVCTRSMIFFSDLMRTMETNNVFEACKYPKTHTKLLKTLLDWALHLASLKLSFSAAVSGWGRKEKRAVHHVHAKRCTRAFKSRRRM